MVRSSSECGKEEWDWGETERYSPGVLFSLFAFYSKTFKRKMTVLQSNTRFKNIL